MNNISKNSGSVLVTVIMLILAMMALAVGLLSTIGSQGLLGQGQVSRIKAEQFSRGLFWKFYHEANYSGSPTGFNETVTLDNHQFNGTVTIGPPWPNGHPELTNAVRSTVTY